MKHNHHQHQPSQQRRVILCAALVIVVLIVIMHAIASSVKLVQNISDLSAAHISNIAANAKIYPKKIVSEVFGKDSFSNTSSLSSLPRIAVAALLTASSKRGEQIERALDGLAVLRRSMLENTPSEIHSSFSFVVMLTDSVDNKWEKILKERLGWTKVKRYARPPVLPSEIKNKIIATEIVTDGAIGIDELTKLDVFNWGDEYDLVFLLDADIFFHRPFPELYTDLSRKALRWTKGGWVSEKINGGFLVIEPKGEVGKQHFKNIMDIVREGDFRSGTGWRGSGIGWTYGGRTVQGVLPYYFLHYLKYPSAELQQKQAELWKKNNNATFFSFTPDDLQLNRCKYNNMDQLPECKALSTKEIVSNHFTGDCWKPWWCNVKRSDRCIMWTRLWKQTYARELKAQNVLSSMWENAESRCDFPSLSRYLYDRL